MARQSLVESQRSWHPLVECIPLVEHDDGCEWRLGEWSSAGEALMLLRRGGDAQAAIRVLTHAVASDPYDAQLWYNLGAAWLRVKHASREKAFASDCFRRAIRLDARSALAHAALAQATASPKEAVQAASAALALTPAHTPLAARASRVLAYAYLAVGLPELALEVIGACAAKHPHDARVLADQAAIALRVRGAQGGARDAIAKACAVAPHWPRLWRLRWETAVG